MTRRLAFTVTELIIVIVIIAVLAAIAVPNFMEVNYRSEVSKSQNDLRSLALAMESYRVDRGTYPASEKDSKLPGRGTGDEVDQRLLTTPVAYLPMTINDPFRKMARLRDHSYDIYAIAYLDDEPSFTTYPRTGWMTWSIGKDLKSNTQGYRSLRAVLDNEAAARPDLAAAGMRYDPTNGSASPGDIYRFEGEAREHNNPVVR